MTGLLHPGTNVGGDFEILRPLKQGGMGAGYVARQRSMGKERALKVMRPGLVADPKLRARFEQEAQLSSSCPKHSKCHEEVPQRTKQDRPDASDLSPFASALYVFAFAFVCVVPTKAPCATGGSALKALKTSRLEPADGVAPPARHRCRSLPLMAFATGGSPAI